MSAPDGIPEPRTGHASALTRRSALGAGAGGVAAAVVLSGAASEAAFTAPPLSLAGPTPAARAFTDAGRLYRRRRFTRRRGRRFRVTGPGVRQRMRLVGVDDLARAVSGSEHSFELTLRAPRPGPAQGTYRLRRPGFAATDLFLVPTDETRRTFRAVVNNR